MINAVIADQPDDLVINTHICRGNFHSTWLSSGGYVPVAAKLFGEENVDAYYLEFEAHAATGCPGLRQNISAHIVPGR